MTSRRALLLAVLVVAVALLVAAIVWTPHHDVPTGPPSDLNVIVLGVDGLDWFLLGKYMEEGALPHIARIFRSAVTGEIDSDRPVLPHVGWPTMGRGGPLSESELAIVGAENHARLFGVAPELVRLVEAHGGRAVSIGWPGSWPVAEGDSSNVAAYAPAALAHPMSLAPALFEGAPGQTGDPAFGEIIDGATRRNLEDIADMFASKIHDGTSGSARADEDLVAVRWGYLADRTALDVAGRIIAEEEPDLALVYMGGLDTAVHRFLAPAMPEFFEGTEATDDVCSDVVLNYYKFVDDAVERLVRLTDNRTLFILCSAYGAHPSDVAPPATGGHEMGPPGVLIARGPRMPRNGGTLALSTRDLAPTILAALGLPVSGNMTGSALIGMIPQDVLEEHPLTLEEPPRGSSESTTAPRESERMERLVSERMGRMAGAP